MAYTIMKCGLRQRPPKPLQSENKGLVPDRGCSYASWQKGGIENANGRLRRWLPRQTNIDNLADEDLQEIAMTYNLTPRKCLGYLTPIQALFHKIGRDVRLRFA